MVVRREDESDGALRPTGSTVEDALLHLAGRRGGESGFSAADVHFGHALAERVSLGKTLSGKQRRAAHRMLRKYAPQLRTVGVDFGEIPEPAEDEESSAPTSASAVDKNRVHLAVVKDRIVAKTPFRFKDVCKGVPGHRWSPEANLPGFPKPGAWTYPASPTAALTLRGAFSGASPVTDAAFDALVGEAERMRAASVHKEATDLPPIPLLKTDAWLHQRQAFAFAREQDACLLAMEMGTGKSLVTVGLVVNQDAQRSLILCPLSVIPVWPREFKTHAGRDVHVVTGPPALERPWTASVADRTGAFDDAIHECRCGWPHVCVANYEVTAHEPFRTWSREQDWDYFIMDESHRIKAANGVWSKHCAKVGRKARRRLALTGTPMANSPLDVFGQYRALDPAVFGTSFTSFCNTLDAPIWMGDLSFKPLGAVQPGERVIGWARDDEYSGRRRIVEAEVYDVGRRIAPEVLEVTMESGRTLRCTPEHKWLSGWHNARNGEVGGDSWVTVSPLRGVEHSEWPVGSCQTCGAPAVRRDSRGPDPLYCSTACKGVAAYRRREQQPDPKRRVLSHVVDPSPDLDEKQQAFAYWLAGMYDGEGSGAAISQSRTANPEICARVAHALDILGVRYRQTDVDFCLLGGRQTYVNLLNWMRPVLTKDRYLRGLVLGAQANPYPKQRNVGAFNRVGDRVASVRSVGPGEVGSMWTSTGNYVAWGYASKNSHKYAVFGGYQGHEILGMDPATEPELNERFYSIAYRVGAEVLDLPPDNDVTRACVLGSQARKLYEGLDRELYAEVGDGLEVNTPNVLVKMLRLQQLTGGSVTTDLGAPVQVDDSKEKLLEEVLGDLSRREPVVVFCRFVHDLDVVSRVAERLGRRFGELSGRRNDLTSEAKMRDDVDVMAVQEQSGGVGIDLTRAHYAVFYSLGFSLGNHLQCRARLVRPGQEHPVLFVHLVAASTIDEDVYAALSERQEVVDYCLRKVTGAAAPDEEAP